MGCAILEAVPGASRKERHAGKSVHPHQTITIDSAGNLYGTNDFGGTYGYGAAYKISPQGVETDLYSTPGPTLNDRLVLDKEGNIYGTTFQGGANGTGSIFKLIKNAE